MKIILRKYGIPTEIINTIMMLYINTSSMVRYTDGDTPFFEITTGVLQGDTLAPFLFIVCLDYILKNALDHNTELGFTLTQKISSRYPATYITYIDYADNIAVTTDTLKYAKILLYQIEEIANDIGIKVNTDNTEYMSYNQNNDINMMRRNIHCIKQVNNFKYIGSYIGSTERDITIRIAQAWSALNSMNTIWKSKMSDNLKRNFNIFKINKSIVTIVILI